MTTLEKLGSTYIKGIFGMNIYRGQWSDVTTVIFSIRFDYIEYRTRKSVYSILN